jgi:hypothetical protein
MEKKTFWWKNMANQARPAALFVDLFKPGSNRFPRPSKHFLCAINNAGDLKNRRATLVQCTIKKQFAALKCELEVLNFRLEAQISVWICFY